MVHVESLKIGETDWDSGTPWACNKHGESPKNNKKDEKRRMKKVWFEINNNAHQNLVT
tara:strand:+ start:642 stop:815 length:174 start_codon:yes stop_codon:yes gene_type:complete